MRFSVLIAEPAGRTCSADEFEKVPAVGVDQGVVLFDQDPGVVCERGEVLHNGFQTAPSRRKVRREATSGIVDGRLDSRLRDGKEDRSAPPGVLALTTGALCERGRE